MTVDRKDPFYYEESGEMKRWLNRGVAAAGKAKEALDAGDFDAMRNSLLESKRCLSWADALSERARDKARFARERVQS